MASPDDIIDPIEQQPPEVQPEPWSWVPPEWSAPAELEQPPSLQPGIGIPTDTLDAAAPPPMGQPLGAPPMPDAVSEVGVPFAPPDAVTGAAPAEASAGPPLDIASATRDAEEKEAIGAAEMSPEKLALRESQLEEERAEVGRIGKAKALKEDRERAEMNEMAYQAANTATQQRVEELQAQAKALADEKVGWAAKGTGSKIAGIMLAFVGGMVQKQTGGRNLAIEAIDKSIEEDIAERREKQKDLRAQIADTRNEFARAADAYRHDELYRQASYEQAIEAIKSDMGNYDPRGTRVVKHAKLIQDIRGRQAASLRKFQVEERDYNIKVATHNLAVQKAKDDKEQAAASNRVAMANAATARAQLDATKESNRLARQDKLDAQARERAEAQEKSDRELGIGGEMRPKTTKQMVADPVTGKQVEKDVTTFEADKLRDKKGDVWHAPSPTAQALIVKQRSGTQDLIDALGELKQLRSAAGGADKYSSPSDQAEFDRLTNKAVIAYATAKGLSLADKQSTDFARNAILGTDPSSYHAGDVEKRISSSIVDAKRAYHTSLTGHGYDGKLPSFEEKQAPAALSDPEQASKTVQQGKTTLEQVESGKPGAIKGAVEQLDVGGSAASILTGSEYKNPEERRAIAAQESGSIDIPGLSKDQAPAVKQLLKDATNPQGDDASRNGARQQLVNLASDPSREALHGPILKVLEDQAPDLFAAAVSKLPKEEQDHWQGYAKIRRRGQ